MVLSAALQYLLSGRARETKGEAKTRACLPQYIPAPSFYTLKMGYFFFHCWNSWLHSSLTKIIQRCSLLQECSFLQTLSIHFMNAPVMLAMLKIIIFENNYTLTWNFSYKKPHTVSWILWAGLIDIFSIYFHLLELNWCVPILSSFKNLQDEFSCGVTSSLENAPFWLNTANLGLNQSDLESMKDGKLAVLQSYFYRNPSRITLQR